MADGTRIQRKNTALILEAALEEFAARGFSGATVDAIARSAGLSKPNVLYYFSTKEAIHAALLESLLDSWLAPLRDLTADADPMEALLTYVRRKLEMSRDMPRESRLFANEILQGAPRIGALLDGTLKSLVDEKAGIIAEWQRAGALASIDPHHLIFSIWSLTQHYADFGAQVGAVLGTENYWSDASDFLDTSYRRMLTPTWAPPSSRCKYLGRFGGWNHPGRRDAASAGAASSKDCAITPRPWRKDCWGASSSLHILPRRPCRCADRRRRRSSAPW